jgi:hypothetical protein
LIYQLNQQVCLDSGTEFALFLGHFTGGHLIPHQTPIEEKKNA